MTRLLSIELPHSCDPKVTEINSFVVANPQHYGFVLVSTIERFIALVDSMKALFITKVVQVLCQAVV